MWQIRHAPTAANCLPHAVQSMQVTMHAQSTAFQGHTSKITVNTSAQTAEQPPEEFKHVQATRLALNAAITVQAAAVFTEGRLKQSSRRAHHV
jgi:hypothetical protein